MYLYLCLNSTPWKAELEQPERCGHRVPLDGPSDGAAGLQPFLEAARARHGVALRADLVRPAARAAVPRSRMRQAPHPVRWHRVGARRAAAGPFVCPWLRSWFRWRGQRPAVVLGKQRKRGGPSSRSPAEGERNPTSGRKVLFLAACLKRFIVFFF